MAQLKDLIVTGASRFIGELHADTIYTTTQPDSDNSTKVATTEYVQNRLNNAMK